MPEVNFSVQDTFETFEYKPPSWLTVEYLENALRSHKKDETIKIEQIGFSPVTGKGENFASTMARVQIRFRSRMGQESECERFIVKTAFEGETFVCDRLEEIGIYKCEMNFYAEILPKLKALMEQIGYHSRIGPDAIKIDYAKDLIIFEDLAPKGYIMPSKDNGLDMTHAKMVLEKLAAMHASSAMLNEIIPGIVGRYNHGMYNRHTDGFGRYFKNNLETCANMVLQWKGYENYGKKLLNIIPKLLEYGRKLFDAKDKNINVLIHGDIWINNTMFRYDQQNCPIDVTLIDYQYCCWTSPTVDLHYFFNTSLQEDLRLNHQDELVKHYYDFFSGFLRKLDFPKQIPTLHDFRLEFVENEFYAFQTACIVQPLMILDDATDACFECLMGYDDRSVNFRKRLYNNKKVHKNLKTLLPIFDRRGVLDI